MLNFIVLQENEKYYFGFDTNNTKEQFIKELKTHVKNRNFDPYNDYCRLIHKININNDIDFRNVGQNFSVRGIVTYDLNIEKCNRMTFANYNSDKFIKILNYKDYFKTKKNI